LTSNYSALAVLSFGMMRRFDVEDIDLELLAQQLRDTFGPSVEGAVIGRTRLRDAVGYQLGCSLLEAEALVDTMVARRFVVARRDLAAGVEWWIDGGRSCA
jgi:hypothetical protein